jgi:hypothetical protein
MLSKHYLKTYRKQRKDFPGASLFMGELQYLPPFIFIVNKTHAKPLSHERR